MFNEESAGEEELNEESTGVGEFYEESPCAGKFKEESIGQGLKRRMKSPHPQGLLS